MCPQSDRVSYEHFRLWVLSHNEATTIVKWLLKEPCTVTLSNDLETPTFYQTLAGVTHCKFTCMFMYPHLYPFYSTLKKGTIMNCNWLHPILYKEVYNLCAKLFSCYSSICI